MELGTIIAMSEYQPYVTILTSTGHLVSVAWDGTVGAGQIYYTGGSCTGTAYLNSGGADTYPIFAKGVFYSASMGTLMVPANPDANGLAQNEAFTSASIDNPSCYASAGAVHGYELEAVTPTAVGLPAYPVAAPLAIG